MGEACYWKPCVFPARIWRALLIWNWLIRCRPLPITVLWQSCPLSSQADEWKQNLLSVPQKGEVAVCLIPDKNIKLLLIVTCCKLLLHCKSPMFVFSCLPCYSIYFQLTNAFTFQNWNELKAFILHIDFPGFICLFLWQMSCHQS